MTLTQSARVTSLAVPLSVTFGNILETCETTPSKTTRLFEPFSITFVPLHACSGEKNIDEEEKHEYLQQRHWQFALGNAR